MENKFYDYKKDGITQGLLQKFMTCREETRLFLQGWSPTRSFSKALTYGSIVHGVLEHIYNDIRLKKLTTIPSSSLVRKYTKITEAQWYKENPGANNDARKMLETSLLIAEATMPIYFKHWWKEDFKKIKWQNLEEKFAIPYKTKSGFQTIIRGKKDGVFGNPKLKLFETKSKSMINESDLLDTLWFEFQVNLYLWALKKMYKTQPTGVLYNIIRRTNLEKKSAESLKQYADRIVSDIRKRPSFYFMRFEVSVTKNDMEKFEIELDALVTDFINWLEKKTGHYKNTANCIRKYGKCPFLSICSSQDFTGFKKRKVVFKELEDL